MNESTGIVARLYVPQHPAGPRKDLEQALLKLCGGYTRLAGEGAYIMAGGFPAYEQVAVYEVVYTHGETIGEALVGCAKTYKDAANQECSLLVFQQVRPVFLKDRNKPRTCAMLGRNGTIKEGPAKLCVLDAAQFNGRHIELVEACTGSDAFGPVTLDAGVYKVYSVGPHMYSDGQFTVSIISKREGWAVRLPQDAVVCLPD